MSKGEEIEIGWKKELLEKKSGSSTKCKSYHRSSSGSSGSSSGSSSSTSSSSSVSETRDDHKLKKKSEKREKHKIDKLLKKEKKKQEKIQKKEMKKAKKEKRKEEKRLKKLAKKMKHSKSEETDCTIPIDLMFTKAQAPETKEEYEARQSKIQRVVDPVTGRSRLIKGDGEILEEIVSRNQHKEINKQATQGDGNFFQAKTIGWKLS